MKGPLVCRLPSLGPGPSWSACSLIGQVSPLACQVQSCFSRTGPFYHEEMTGWPEAGPPPGLACAIIPSLGRARQNLVLTGG